MPSAQPPALRNIFDNKWSLCEGYIYQNSIHHVVEWLGIGAALGRRHGLKVFLYLSTSLETDDGRCTSQPTLRDGQNKLCYCSCRRRYHLPVGVGGGCRLAIMDNLCKTQQKVPTRDPGAADWKTVARVELGRLSEAYIHHYQLR